MTTFSLEQLGWNDHFEKALASAGKQGLVPARVIAEHRGRYRVAGRSGEVPATVTGRMMYLAGERLDFPVVGDWVLTSAGLSRFLAEPLVSIETGRQTSLGKNSDVHPTSAAFTGDIS